MCTTTSVMQEEVNSIVFLTFIYFTSLREQEETYILRIVDTDGIRTCIPLQVSHPLSHCAKIEW